MKCLHRLGMWIAGFFLKAWKPESSWPEPPLLWLQAELQLARYSDCLAHLPFLDQLLTQDGMSVQEGHIMQTLAQRAVAILDSAEDDVVFCYGVSAVKIMTAVELKAQATTGHEIMKPWEAVISHVKPWRHDTQWYSMILHVQCYKVCESVHSEA